MRFPVVWAVLAIPCLASSPFDPILRLLNKVIVDYNPPQERSLPDTVTVPARLGNVTRADVNAARSIVNEALDQLEELNRARLSRPSRNQYSPRPNGRLAQLEEPTFKLTDELVAAANLVAEIDDLKDSSALNRTAGPVQRVVDADGTFWMQGMQRKGSWPWGTNPGGHTVRVSSTLPRLRKL
jgi:hypothetical protein